MRRAGAIVIVTIAEPLESYSHENRLQPISGTFLMTISPSPSKAILQGAGKGCDRIQYPSIPCDPLPRGDKQKPLAGNPRRG